MLGTGRMLYYWMHWMVLPCQAWTQLLRGTSFLLVFQHFMFSHASNQNFLLPIQLYNLSVGCFCTKGRCFFYPRSDCKDNIFEYLCWIKKQTGETSIVFYCLFIFRIETLPSLRKSYVIFVRHNNYWFIVLWINNDFLRRNICSILCCCKREKISYCKLLACMIDYLSCGAVTC